MRYIRSLDEAQKLWHALLHLRGQEAYTVGHMDDIVHVFVGLMLKQAWYRPSDPRSLTVMVRFQS